MISSRARRKPRRGFIASYFVRLTKMVSADDDYETLLRVRGIVPFSSHEAAMMEQASAMHSSARWPVLWTKLKTSSKHRDHFDSELPNGRFQSGKKPRSWLLKAFRSAAVLSGISRAVEDFRSSVRRFLTPTEAETPDHDITGSGNSDSPAIPAVPGRVESAFGCDYDKYINGRYRSSDDGRDDAVFRGWNASSFLRSHTVAVVLEDLESESFLDPTSDHHQLLFSLLRDYILAFEHFLHVEPSASSELSGGIGEETEDRLFDCFWNHFPYLDRLDRGCGGILDEAGLTGRFSIKQLVRSTMARWISRRSA